MVLARRLFVAGGGEPFVVLRAVRELTSSPQGGWTQIQDPKAVYYNGSTYFVYAPDTGTSGDLVVGRYVHATSVVTTHTLETAYETPPDNHSSPSVIVRSSDQRLVVAAARHAETGSPTVFISPTPEDITGTWTEVNPDPSIGAAQYTYMVLYEMDDGTIYMLYRDYISGTNTGRLGFTTSTDGGSTWSSRLILYTGATGEVPYWRIISDGTLIHVFTTDVEPDASALGHFYYDHDAGTVHASDGTPLTWNGTSTLLDWSDITEIQGATCWSWGASIDSLGRPATVIMRDIGGDNAIDVARWRSGAWQVDEVVASVGGQLGINQYASGCGIHHTNPDIVYVAEKIAGKFEMFRYTSPDDGATWSGTQLTSGSTDDNVWADVVHDAGPGLEGIWLVGDYTSDTDYAFGISGYG